METFISFFWLSGCFWLFFNLYIILRVSNFIVKRYEVETNLLETAMFRKHATFTRHLPDFYSSAFYSAHLMMCTWGWIFWKNRKVFKDIDDPKIITDSFSKKEILTVKIQGLSNAIFMIHLAAYYALQYYFPELMSG